MIEYFSNLLFLIAAAGFASLGVSIFRRARRTSEVRVLLFMLIVFTLQFLLLSFGRLFFSLLGIMPAQSRALLSVSAESLSLLALGAVFHFVFLAYNKAADENGLSKDSFPLPRIYGYNSRLWLIVGYSAPVVYSARYVIPALRAWHDPSNRWMLLSERPPAFHSSPGGRETA